MLSFAAAAAAVAAASAAAFQLCLFAGAVHAGTRHAIITVFWRATAPEPLDANIRE